MSEPLLEASLTAEGLLSTTRPPGTGVEVGGVDVGVAAEAVLAGWLDLGVGAGVTTDDVDTDWSLSELTWFVVPLTTPPMMDTPAPAAAVELEAPDNSSVGKELPTSFHITKRNDSLLRNLFFQSRFNFNNSFFFLNTIEKSNFGRFRSWENEANERRQ